MAKYTINHECGHQAEVQLFGKHSERDRKIAWLEGQDCPSCRSTRLAAGRAAQAEQDGQTAHLAGLPVLQGSEKQVAWAETIRLEKLSWLKKLAEKGTGLPESLTVYQDALKEHPYTPENWSALADAAIDAGISASEKFGLQAQAIVKILGETSAKWWIDHRHASMVELIGRLVEEPARVAKERAEAERLAKEKADAEQAKLESVRKDREERDEIITRMREWLPNATSLVVWSKDVDIRVYIGRGYGKDDLVYYHTGNARTKPGSVEASRLIRDQIGEKLDSEVIPFLANLCKKWKSLKVTV